METLTCEVVSWRDEPRESSGWHIITVRGLDDAPHTVTGCNLPRPGSRCEFTGEWQTTKWGEQFHVRAITATKPPLTAAGVARWLEDRCEGIGKVKAAAILKHFGDDPQALWASLGRGPEGLAKVPGLNADVAAHVYEAFEADGEAREHYGTLRGWRLTQAQITRITKHWPIADACRRLYEDPYLLAEHISGFGFKRADEIARTVGVPKHSRMRVRAGILHCMDEAAQQGHVFGDMRMFGEMSRTFLDVPMSETTAVVQELLDAKRLVTPDGARIYLPVYERAEAAVADATGTMMMFDRPSDANFTVDARAEAEAKNWQVDPEQMAAVQLVADMGRQLGFITGGPGTGKTTILSHAVAALESQGVQVILAAPTGKAAKRMTEATGRDAVTLHRLLEFRPEHVVDCETCSRSTGSYKRVSIGRAAIIVDESSMVDLQLWGELMRAVNSGGLQAAVRFVGDADQLPPVGPGQPFQDHLKALADTTNVVRLKSVHRQGPGSWVATSAPMVLAGRMPSLEQRTDFRFLEVARADHIPSTIEAALSGEYDTELWSGETLRAEYIPERGNPTRVPAPVLVPQRNGVAGMATINKVLSEYHKPPALVEAERDPMQDLIRIALEDGTDLRVGARVMCLKNDYARNVRNGDTGVIEHMEMERDKRGEPRPVTYVRLDPDETYFKAVREAELEGLPRPACPLITYNYQQAREQLALGYAMTIHKSQGSQYPWIVVVCHSTHTRMLTRRLLYTALTRASEGVVLVGNREGFERAVANAQETPRNTWLQALIRAALAARAPVPGIREAAQ
jgi:exodeoxyribonuclease V alpha subunit